ncbi:EutN/CcmL family microcompartment protein [Phycisphaeraceae bacterium D3-23]
MFIGRVQGHIVSSAKDEQIVGHKLLMIEPLKIGYSAPGNEGTASGFEPTGRAIVALDKVGAGEGQLVLITQGSSARMAKGCGDAPIDAVVVGIVDSAVADGKQLA